VVDVPGGGKAFSIIIKDKGQNAWSVQMRHRGITLENGHTYTVRFKIWADKPTQAYAKIGMMGDPYTEYWNNDGQKNQCYYYTDCNRKNIQNERCYRRYM